ncbi:MAG: DUF4468 domain-containing protein [Polaromonas sp.]
MKIIAAIALAGALVGCATTEQGQALSVVSVHEAPGKSKQQICIAARDWTTLAFKDSGAVIDVFDADLGKLMGKGNMTVNGYDSTPFRVNFTMTIECQDGRIRYSFDDYRIASQGRSYPLTEDGVNHLQTKAWAKTVEMAKNLESQLVMVGRSDR